MRAAMAMVVWAAFLAGCAGTVKQDSRFQGDVSLIQGVSQVTVQMSPEAQRQQADNVQFNRDELANYLRRRLESKGLIAPSATHRIDIVVTAIRVRSAFAAVMFGFMAGEDHVQGRVRLLDPSGKVLRSFDINASYALGGWGGGQDGLRMNWLYDKFSQLAASEIDRFVQPPRPAAPAPVITPVSASASAPVAPPPPPVVPRAPSGYAAIDDVNAVPLSDKGRAAYSDWLTRVNPRAFVIADGGHWVQTVTTKPKDPTLPRDPVERALKICQDRGWTGCTLYAVDQRVVYVKPAAAAATQP